MDSLALNIFVPDGRTSKAQKVKKPLHTVVKDPLKADKLSNKTFQKKVVWQSSTQPVKTSFIKTKIGKNDDGKTFKLFDQFNKAKTSVKKVRNDDEEGFSVNFAKPKLFEKKIIESKPSKTTPNDPRQDESPVREPKVITFGHEKTKIGKNEDGGKTFRLSNQFNQAKTSVKEVRNDDEEGFSVNFVKPKLFKKKLIESKPSKATLNDPPQDESPIREPKVITFDHEKTRKSHFWKPQVEKVAQGVGFDKEKVTKKWFGNGDVDRKIQIAFPVKKDGRIKEENDTEKVEVDEKPKVKVEKVIGGTKRKWRESENDENVKDVLKNEAPKVDLFQDGGRNKRLKDSTEPQINTGRISSLFNSESSVEKLNDASIEPLEERLFSRKGFADVGVHPHLVGNLEQLFGIRNMTVVQKKTIPALLAGQDALVRSQTGSGKTLAYAIPIMHTLQALTPKLTRKDGVKALVVLPTRELALQTYECFSKLMRAFTWIVPGIVVGGEKRTSEKARLRKGINVLVGTPGRLLDHAEHTENLNLHGIDWLIIDEADKLLEMGYEKDVSQLINIIDTQRANNVAGRKQTVLLSATLTSAVERLASLTLNNPAHIDACTNSQETVNVLVIPQSLQQRYVVVPAKLRLVALASYLVDVAEMKKSNKILVFMATQDMVDYYLELLQGVLTSSVKFYKLHGNMSQGDRTEVFNRFRSSDKGVLLSTDVAARGLDLPKVDWIVQYTAPTTPAEYVHRVGRTARVGSSGSALLFLLPSELHFVSMLNSSRIKLEEVSVDNYLKSLMKIHLESKDGQRWGGGVEGAATVLQHNFENSVINDADLHEMACKAYKSWVRFYATYPKDLRVVFDFKSLHLGHNAKSFALRDPPRAIGGIGKPQKGQKQPKTEKRVRTRKTDLGHVTSSSRTKQLITSEFDSGLKPIRKMK